MYWLLFGMTAILAVLSSNSAAPTDSAPLRLQFPQLPLPTNPIEIDEQSRAQARSVLDDVLSQYPTLVDSVAGLLKTQQLLTSVDPLQTLNFPISQFDTPDLSRSLPGLPRLPSLPGLSGDSLLASSTLSTLIDGFLDNLRTMAASPMQLAPIRFAPPGGTPVVSSTGTNSPLIDVRSLFPELPQLPKLIVPLVFNLPNEEGLPANDVIENLRQRVRDQMPSGSNGDLQAEISFDPLLNIINAKPVAPAAPAKPEGYTREPVRTSVPGGLLGGNTDVQIFLKEAIEQQAQNVRKALDEAQRNLPYP